ncbi:MAG: hypothetical protein JO219_03360 [Candidatus Eremiobacteraeota bacterium]|nr:hypothetical protein [Candidatus Eremiobacteraeota bacterium]
MTTSRRAYTLILAGMTFALSACANGGAPPTPTPTGHLRLFVTNFAGGGATSSLVAYVFPLSSGSAPNSTLTSSNGINGARGLAFDFSDDLFVANSSNATVTAYLPPVGNSSVPALTITSGVGTPEDITFDFSLDLYVASLTGGSCGGTGYVALYTSPLSSTSVPAFTFCAGMNAPRGVVYDGASTIWVANSGGNNVTAYAFPLSAASSPSATLTSGVSTPYAVAIDGSGNLWVVNHGNNSVAVYSPPLTSASTPAFTITNGINAPNYMTFGTNGTLYVANATNVTAYQPPFSSSSAPTLTIATGLNGPAGVAVGN